MTKYHAKLEKLAVWKATTMSISSLRMPRWIALRQALHGAGLRLHRPQRTRPRQGTVRDCDANTVQSALIIVGFI